MAAGQVLASIESNLSLTDLSFDTAAPDARPAIALETVDGAVIGGLTPTRLVLGGMGLEGLAGWTGRGAFFIDAIDRFDSVKSGDPAFPAVSFMKSMKVDRVAARLLLQTFADTPPEALAALVMPTCMLTMAVSPAAVTTIAGQTKTATAKPV